VREPDEGVLDIEIRDDLIVLRGELDMETVGHLTKQLEAVEGTVIVDLDGVTFLDSTGLQSLVHARDAARQRGDDVILRHPSAAVSRVLDVTNMWESFAVER
jgi:anti-anti-sigma factor